MLNELREFADVHAGHPFRGSVPEIVGGPVLAVQMRDVSAIRGVVWDKAARTDPDGRKEPDWLQAGDILFVARGARNFAICLDEVPSRAVCSQYFFVIRLRNRDLLLPEFLAWQINQLPAQRYLSKNAEGTDQLSIRRGVLEGMPIAAPSVVQQRQLIDLDKMARQERVLLEGLIHNRERQIQELVFKLLTKH
jgi:hypothetical protein